MKEHVVCKDNVCPVLTGGVGMTIWRCVCSVHLPEKSGMCCGSPCDDTQSFWWHVQCESSLPSLYSCDFKYEWQLVMS